MGQTEISGRCYGKNGEWKVVDFACVKSRRISILHNLTDMRRKPSAGFGLRVDRVPVAYQRALVVLCGESFRIREGCGDEMFGDTLAVGCRK
jgi:hypothetical protein